MLYRVPRAFNNVAKVVDCDADIDLEKRKNETKQTWGSEGGKYLLKREVIELTRLQVPTTPLIARHRFGFERKDRSRINIIT